MNKIKTSMTDKITQFIRDFNIGYHTKKEKTLMKTIENLKSNIVPPYQIFLGNPQSVKMSISDEELLETTTLVNKTKIKIYVHSQYIINLSNDDDYVSECLSKNLQYANICGFRGVVVHVGKYTKKKPEVAIEIMYQNILKSLEYATEECPLLLETPAGQGTETLTTCKEFMDFMGRFGDKLGKTICICVDTCHVFASGADPLEYIEQINPNFIKLVHFNDSKTICGSCVDRHEWIGDGKIGFEKMYEIAVYCKGHSINMVYEG